MTADSSNCNLILDAKVFLRHQNRLIIQKEWKKVTIRYAGSNKKSNKDYLVFSASFKRLNRLYSLSVAEADGLSYRFRVDVGQSVLSLNSESREINLCVNCDFYFKKINRFQHDSQPGIPRLEVTI